MWKIKHWLCGTRIYRIRSNMNTRCYNNKAPVYKYYWKRWISVLWENFQEFYKDMWHTYSDWLSIDRIDNNWNYCKENCRWATSIEQNNNMNSNRLIEYNWKELNMRQWSATLWINYRTLSYRLNAWWKTIKEAFETPIQKHLYTK